VQNGSAMKSSYLSSARSQKTSHVHDVSDPEAQPAHTTIPPATDDHEDRGSNFWRNRLIEIGLALSMALYYLVGNPYVHIPIANLLLQKISPFYSLPFLLIFAILSWYRLSFAVALLPLSFPYYYLPKLVYQRGSPTQDVRFSLIEILLWTCVVVAGLRFLVGLRRWPYREQWQAWLKRIGPFLIPFLLFAAAALISIFVAYVPYGRTNAIRTFRQEVAGPLLFLGLALLCLRTRQDIKRLLIALFGSGVILGCAGLIQFVFFKNTLLPDPKASSSEGLLRMTLVFGSGNNLGLLLDYTLPIGLALVLARVSWKVRLVVLAFCLPCFFVLYESQSRGSWAIAIPLAIIIIVGLAWRKRNLFLVYAAFLVVAALFGGILFRTQLYDYLINGHTDQQGFNTASKRVYLWQSALEMIHDRPWFGYGLDNWLCYYSSGDKYHPNTVCPTPAGFHHYIITQDPVTKRSTGMSNEPFLSHPHNIFLHVWVSMGIFGLLAFIAVLVLFYWTLVRLLFYLHKRRPPYFEELRWMTIGIGISMLAAVVQGQMDSSFLEQDLAFCFWTLVLALLLLRSCAGMPWRVLLSRGDTQGDLSNKAPAAG
jgi:putative inorganic carbon (HCO3(-)) transporter